MKIKVSISILMSSFFLLTSCAVAPAPEIPPDSISANFSTEFFSDSDGAGFLWRQMLVPSTIEGGPDDNGLFATYRVSRSKNGLEMTACQRISNFKTREPRSYTCFRQVSRDGKVLPLFDPVIFH